MKPMTRRTAVKSIATAALGAGTLMHQCMTYAQAAFPSKPIRLIVPYPPGGFTDVVSRLVGERLSARLGQPLVADNKPGAGTNLGADLVAKAAPDGYTLFMGTSSLAINPALYGRLNYDPQKDLIPIGAFATTGYVLLASMSTPASNLKDFVAWAKKQGDQLTFGSSGNGAVNHLAGELFNSLAGTRIRHVPYRGSQMALVDLMGGRLDLFFASTLEALPLLKSGKVRALGITNPKRLKIAEDIPAIGEVVKGYECLFWMGLFAPKGTPPPILQTLSTALESVMSRADMRGDLYVRGAEATFLNADFTRVLLEVDTRKWGALVKSSGATAT